MPTVEQRANWARKHVRSKEGRVFSLEGRAWVIDEFWVPADGWRLAARDKAKLCEECQQRVGTLYERFDWVLWDQGLEHAANSDGKCAGTKLVPILCVVLNLPRREGKTFNVCTFILTLIFLCMRRFVLFVASAGDQTERLFEDNIEAVIDQSPAMKGACTIVGNQVSVPSTRSRLDVAKTTSHRSITGGGYTHIVLEEARDLAPRTVAAAILSIRDQNGYECPVRADHVVRPGIGRGEYKKEACPHCGALLVPWYPRIIIPSSSGIIEDSERDWFNQLVEQLETDCPANYHVFRSEVSTNPAVREDITEALAAGFGKVEALKTYMDVELTNKKRRKGEDFVTQADLNSISERDLLSAEGSTLQCVAFLDTSWSSDKTTFLVAGWDPGECAFPWQCLRMLHWKIWEPKKMQGGLIDENAVQAHLDHYVPNFPALELALVDDRGMDWAKRLVARCNKDRRGWGSKIRLFHGKKVVTATGKIEKIGARIPGIFGGEDDRSLAWQLLEQRIMSGPSAIRIPADKELHKELLGATRVPLPEGGYEIRDRNRKKRHVDIADALAGAAFLAYLVATNPRRRLDPSYAAKNNPALASIFKPGVTKDYGFNDF